MGMTRYVYGLKRLDLDEFSALETRWVPDTDSLRVFWNKADRDLALSELDAACESYEAYIPLDIAPIRRDEFERSQRKAKKNNVGFMKYLP